MIKFLEIKVVMGGGAQIKAKGSNIMNALPTRILEAFKKHIDDILLERKSKEVTTMKKETTKKAVKKPASKPAKKAAKK